MGREGLDSILAIHRPFPTSPGSRQTIGSSSSRVCSYIESMRASKFLHIFVGPIASLVFLCPWLLGNSECNAFSGTADKTGDAAQLYAARQQIDQGQYAAALTTIGQMTAAGQSSHDGVVLAASAHAGLCGLNLVTFGYDVSQGLSGGKTLFPVFLTEMKAATGYTDCTAAETLMLSVPAAQMTNDDYIFLAFVEFAKIGAALESASVDTTAHQGVVNPSLNTCATSPLTDAIVGDIGVGLTIAANSIKQSGIAIGGSISQICSVLNCSITSSSSFSASDLLILRGLFKSNEIGFNLCGGSFGTGTCHCP